MSKRITPRNVIYGLYCVCPQCPAWNPIRYVGLTSEKVTTRFYKHLYSARHGKPWPVSRWVNKHGPENIRYRILEQAETSDLLDHLEEKWIARLATLITQGGYNVRPGGQSSRGYTHAPDAATRRPHVTSQETRDKIRATVLAKSLRGQDGHNAKLTDDDVIAIKARMWSGETDLSISRDYGLSTAAINYIRQGRTWSHIPNPVGEPVPSPTGRFAAGSKPPNTKLTEDDVRYIRRESQAGRHATDLAAEFSVTKENISMIVQRKTWKNVE